MQFAIVGLGRIGGNLARHALEKGHRVVGYSKDAAPMIELICEGLDAAGTLASLVEKLPSPRIVFVYVPSGEPTESVVHALRPLLAPGDVVADGGNSRWVDSQRRHAFLAETGVFFLDIGTSGGVTGARRGPCFMVGGDRKGYDVVAPILQDLAFDAEGVIFVGGPGSGHFVKLVHNAIELGMMQVIGEGVELLQRSGFVRDLGTLFNNWLHGSVVRGWLIELMGKALKEHSDFDSISTYIEDTGEVKWLLEWALERDIPLPVANAAQISLMGYRNLGSIAAKSVALLRNQCGGHPIHYIHQNKYRSKHA